MRKGWGGQKNPRIRWKEDTKMRSESVVFCSTTTWYNWQGINIETCIYHNRDDSIHFLWYVCVRLWIRHMPSMTNSMHSSIDTSMYTEFIRQTIVQIVTNSRTQEDQPAIQIPWMLPPQTSVYTLQTNTTYISYTGQQRSVCGYIWNPWKELQKRCSWRLSYELRHNYVVLFILYACCSDTYILLTNFRSSSTTATCG